jgi:hypothetical protein
MAFSKGKIYRRCSKSHKVQIVECSRRAEESHHQTIPTGPHPTHITPTPHRSHNPHTPYPYSPPTRKYSPPTPSQTLPGYPTPTAHAPSPLTPYHPHNPGNHLVWGAVRAGFSIELFSLCSDFICNF